MVGTMQYRDRRLRSVAKGASWRLAATCDTIILAWIFTGAFDIAIKIGISEIVTKIALYYLHERIWERWQMGTLSSGDSIHEKHYRSIIKAISWRFFGTLDTILFALLWTGDYAQAFSLGAVELVSKIALFWLHERIWLKIEWGRRNTSSSILPHS